MEKSTCLKCDSEAIKNGRLKGVQRLRCKKCKTDFMARYRYQAYRAKTNEKIIALLKEGCGTRSIARLLRISTTTVQALMLRIAKSIQEPVMSFGKEYEVDELCTFIGSKTKKRWIAYLPCRENRQVLDYRIGGRANKTSRHSVRLNFLISNVFLMIA